MRGQFNSSITRVRPFFSALLARSASGEKWLAALLENVPNHGHLPERLRSAPGQLLPTLAEARPYPDRVLGRTIPLPRCFEHLAPPSRAFLRWLIEHPDQMRWPERRTGERFTYGGETQWRREALIEGDVAQRGALQQAALAELKRFGPEGSLRKWWAFEGHTEVDCWPETDRLLLFVEGKRTEPLSASTHWYPERNQLVRNLEVVGELADGRAAGVLLTTEEAVVELTAEAIALSTPHLNEVQHARLWDRYLGQTTWRVLCDRLGVDYASLPKTIAEVIATTP
jgi:hypothetical protein